MKSTHTLGRRAAALLLTLLMMMTLAPMSAFAAEVPAEGEAPPVAGPPAGDAPAGDAPAEDMPAEEPAAPQEEPEAPAEEAAPPPQEEAAPAEEEEAAPAEDLLAPPEPGEDLAPNGEGVYEVASREDLFTLAHMVNRDAGAVDFAGKTVVLTADVDLTGYPWTPIGTQARSPDGYQRPFKGSFNGGFHTITGLTVDTTGLDTYNAGSALFGYVAQHTPASEIKNIILTGVSVTGGEFTAGVVGKLEGGTVSACAVVGNVAGGGKHVGGLVGQGGTVSQSFHMGGVTGLHTVGGIAGSATVQDCYNIGPVHATTTASHENSSVGGVLGSGTGPLRCYAVGEVTGKPGDASVGAATGFEPGVVPAVGTYFFDIDKSGLVAAYNYNKAIGLPTQSMTYGNYLGAMNALGDAYTKRGGDNDNFYYPELAVFAENGVPSIVALSKNSVKAPTFEPDHNPGWTHDEDDSNAYTIRTPKDLRSLALAVNYGGIPGVNGGNVYDFARCVISLEADLDLSAYANWEPIGKWVEEELRVPAGLARPFKGRFNGNMHLISNLTMNYPRADRPYDTSTALFGHLTYSSAGTGKEAQINGVILRDADITGGKYTAGVVAHSDGVGVWYCGVLGDVTGGQYTGGVVGRTKTAMTRRCFHRGEVSGTGDVGGVIGAATGSSSKIWECYNVGPVSATGGNVGGVAGYGQVTFSYAAGAVSGGDAATLGPVTGNFSSGSNTSGCHFNSDLCGAEALANPGGAQGLSTAKLVSAEVFSHIPSSKAMDDHFVKRPSSNNESYYLELVYFALNEDESDWLPVGGQDAVPAAVASRDSVVAGLFLTADDILVAPITKAYDGSADFGDISARLSLRDGLLPGASIVASAAAKDADAGEDKPLTLTQWQLTGPGTEGIILPEPDFLTGTITPLDIAGASLDIDPPTGFTQPGQKVTATHPLLPAGLLKWRWSYNGQRILGANSSSFTLSRRYEDGTLTVTAYHPVNCEGETSLDFAVAALSVPVSAVKIDGGPLTLITGKSRQLAASVIPEDAQDKALVWASSNPLVATVAADGTVAALGAGRALISATSLDGGHVGYCQVTVEQSAVTLGRARLLLGPDDSQAVSLTANDPDASLAAEVWTTDRKGPSTLATATLAAGAITVTQTGGAYGSCLLRVFDQNDPAVWAECLVQTAQSTAPAVRHAAPATVTASVYRRQPGAVTLQYAPGDGGAYLMGEGVTLGFEPAPGKSGASPTDLALAAQATLNNAFTLTPVDEDTIALTPKWSDVEDEAFTQLLKKSSYQVRIGVALGGAATRTDLIPETITVKIDKKLPKLTAHEVHPKS